MSALNPGKVEEEGRSDPNSSWHVLSNSISLKLGQRLQQSEEGGCEGGGCSR